MAKWLPPIPSGALWSPAAIAIGPAVPLLAWCYDAVQGDGWVDINLHTAAGDMGVPYPTVKRWWGALRASEFFMTVDEKGRRGMRAKFAEQWLDRRILAARETGSEVIPNEAPKAETGANRDGNGTETGSLLNGLYIGTHVSHSDSVTAGAFAPPSRPTRKARAAKPDVTPEPIRQAIAAACAAESGRMLARVNKAAKAIWSRQQANGKTADQTVAAVPLVAAFLRRTVYPYTEGQPLTPEAFDDRWAAAAEDEKSRRRQIAELTAEPKSAEPKPKRLTPAESAARMRELDAARRNGGTP